MTGDAPVFFRGLCIKPPVHPVLSYSAWFPSDTPFNPFIFMRILSTSSLLLAAMLTACSATTMTPGVNASALASASPSALLCPAASVLESQTLKSAPHCVAATVGILSTHGKGMASGSGVVVSADGLIVTAGHVVDAPGTRLMIRFPDGRVVQGVTLGVDRGADSGLAKITDIAPPGGWPFAPMAPSASAKNGEWVLATGNPGGVVVGRNPPLRLGRITIHTDKLLQSDCTVVSGDSGGPLFDLQGRVVGINSNISLSTDENHHVPISVYHAQWADLLAGKKIESKGGMLDKSKETPKTDRSRIGEAMNKLAKEGDAEAKKLQEEAKASGGRLGMTGEKMDELILRAKLADKPKDAPKPDRSRIGEALDKLVKEGDAEAKKLVEEAKASGGKLGLIGEKMDELILRAKLGEKVDMSRIGEAMDKLAKEGDAEVKKLREDAKANGGKMNLDSAKAKELILRAKLPPKPADANKITDIMEAVRRLAASGDAEGKKLLEQASKDGKLELKAAEIQRLLDAASKLAGAKPSANERGIPQAMRPQVREGLRKSLLQQFPGATLTDAVLEGIMDKSSFDPSNGHLNVHPDMDDLKAMKLAPEMMAKHVGTSLKTTRVSQRLGETSLQALALFAPALDAAGDCIVEVYGDGKPILMGTVVDADGWIVTKASALAGKTTVILDDGTALDAKVVGKDEATDIALLKVDGKGRNLEAARFGDETALGAWLVSPVRDPNRPAVGVVSVGARPIPQKFTHFQGEQKIMLGLGPKDPASCVVGQVTPDLPAAKAGVKEGDEIVALNGQPAKDWMDFVTRIRATKPGDTAVIKVRRAGQELELKALLGEAKVNSATHESVGETDALAGGKLSARRTGFPAAIQHDAVVWADQCGGPLLDLKGHAVGINIARYDRVCTFAIPAKQVREVVAKLRAEADKPAPAPAPAPAAAAPVKK